MEAWERAWLHEKDAWQGEIDTEPGVFSGLCLMDCLDAMDPADFVGWYKRQGAK